MSNSYNKISYAYDVIVEPFFSAPKRLATRILCKQFNDPANVRLLEVAGGTGTQAIQLVEMGFAVCVMEKAQGMIRQIIKKARRINSNRLSVCCGDAAQIPFSDAFFDGVVLQMSLHEMDSKTRSDCIFEIKRVTKKSAIYLFLDFVPVRRKTISHFLILTAEYLAGTKHYRNGRVFVKSGGLIRLLHRSGFQVIRSYSFFQKNILLAVAVKN